MLSDFNRSYASAYTFYSQGIQHEIWAHLDASSLLIQVRIFLPDGSTKILKNSMRQIVVQNSIISSQKIFEQLKQGNIKVVDHKKGTISIQGQKIGFGKKSTSIQIKLQEVKNQPLLDNWMLINLLQQKIQRKEKEYYEGFVQTEDQFHQYFEPRPIHHENDKYRFYAELDLINRQITTELIVKGFEKQSRYKDRCYKSTIRQTDWNQDYQKQFRKIQNLFQHLRDPHNYDVLYTKGLIKIKNEPKLNGDFEVVKKLQRLYTERKPSTSDLQILKFKKKIQSQKQTYKNAILEKEIVMKKQLDSIGEKLEQKLLTYIKSTEKELTSRQKQEFKRYRGRLQSLQKQIRKQMDKKLKIEIQSIREEAMKAVNEIKNIYESRILQSKANMRKSHLFEARHRAIVLQQQNKKEQLVEESKPKLLIDQKSSQIDKFKIISQSDIIYKGSWDWTQLYTNLKIGFDGIYHVKFKIISTLFSAIAIGVSSDSNAPDRSSLAKMNSISYWGDGEIWQKQKIKQQGTGFKVGDLVTLKVNRSKGQIIWLINESIGATYNSKILTDKTCNYSAYLEMYDEGDHLQLIGFQVK